MFSSPNKKLFFVVLFSISLQKEMDISPKAVEEAILYGRITGPLSRKDVLGIIKTPFTLNTYILVRKPCIIQS
jgi:hypothetical protein